MLPESLDLQKTITQTLATLRIGASDSLFQIQTEANYFAPPRPTPLRRAMDVLKRELQRKRQLLDADFGGRKLLRRAEIELREIERIREAERHHLLQKQLRSSHHRRAASRSTPGASNGDESRAEHRGHGEEKDALLPREEVIRRLRVLRQPATLFGEDDAARLRRLHAVLEDPAALTDVDAAEIGEGQTNDFLRDIQALRAKAVAAAAKPKAGAATAESGGKAMEEVPFEELCDEDKIMAFFERLMSEWSQEMDEMPEAERRTAKGKAAVATCKQCARYLEPLFKLCKKKALPEDVRGSLLEVVRCCMRRDYLAAVDNYIKLAIGNSPWPIGVTMVGIHERSAREKIYANSVAHIMNDETTRKYLQSVKRLMTFCQRKYPTDPSRSVEFNSLANGSDLQSLLAEQNAKNSEETLRLVAAS